MSVKNPPVAAENAIQPTVIQRKKPRRPNPFLSISSGFTEAAGIVFLSSFVI